jgi:hypothetical protein
VADKPPPYELTNADWGKIHKKAWKEPDFRTQLEQDPTAAIKLYLSHKLHRDMTLETIKIVKLRPAPDPDDVPEDFWDDVNPFPPSCC